MKNKTAIEHINRVNKAINFIQKNLDNHLTLEKISEVACFSPFHFHRIFKVHTGESLSSYIKRLRLERASILLCYSNEAVSDIALKAGYETPSAFNKAFKQYFGESPSSFRQHKTVAPIKDERVIIKHKTGEHKMKHELRQREETLAIYSRKIGNYNLTASEAWKSVCEFAFPRQLVNEESEFIGISHDNPKFTEEEKLRYDACITIGNKIETEGEIGLQTIPGGKYAVFLHEGSYETLSETYAYIYGEWIQTAPDCLSERPCFEKYLNDPEQTPPEELLTEIFVPVE